MKITQHFWLHQCFGNRTDIIRILGKKKKEKRNKTKKKNKTVMDRLGESRGVKCGVKHASTGVTVCSAASHCYINDNALH